MGDLILHDLKYFGPEITLTGTLLAGILADLLFRRKPTAVIAVVTAGFLLTAAFLISGSGTAISIFSNMIAVDPFSWYFKLVILLSALFVLLFSLGAAELNSPGRKLGEYYVLLPALTLGLMLMAGQNRATVIHFVF